MMSMSSSCRIREIIDRKLVLSSAWSTARQTLALRASGDWLLPMAMTSAPAARAMSAQIAPMIIGAANDGKWSAKAVTRELGGRDFSGVRAEGSQRSYTIPAGEIGNRAPIEVSSETWYSPELQVTVYHKRSDPRSGDVVYRLDKLKRGEPPAALFSVPSDYTVRDPLKVSSARAVKKDN